VKLPNGGDSLTLLHGAIVNGYSMVTFKRPQLGVDELYDQHVYSDGQQSIIWAIGSLNSRKEIAYHRLRSKANIFIDFARNPQWNCPIPDLNASMHSNSMGNSSHSNSGKSFNINLAEKETLDQPMNQNSNLGPPISPDASQVDQTVLSEQGGVSPADDRAQASSSDQSGVPTEAGPPDSQDLQQQQSWFIPSIVCPIDRTFYAQVGPAGGPAKGLASIATSVWYINGLMVPELVVERGQVYRFIVEGGNDKTVASRRHPLYLTDSQEGGFNFKTDDERQRERLFGGVALRATDGQFVATAEGRLCEWRPTAQTASNPDLYQTFAAFQRTLTLSCAPGPAAVLKFQPDAQSPNELFYQCYTHRFMGGRIRVVDSCAQFMASHQTQGQTGPTERSSTNVSN